MTLRPKQARTHTHAPSDRRLWKAPSSHLSRRLIQIQVVPYKNEQIRSPESEKTTKKTTLEAAAKATF